MSETTKAIVDYAEDGNAIEVRNALYSAIETKVMDHLEAEKQRIAKTMFNQPELETEVAVGVETDNENA